MHVSHPQGTVLQPNFSRHQCTSYSRLPIESTTSIKYLCGCERNLPKETYCGKLMYFGQELFEKIVSLWIVDPVAQSRGCNKHQIFKTDLNFKTIQNQRVMKLIIDCLKDQETLLYENVQNGNHQLQWTVDSNMDLVYAYWQMSFSSRILFSIRIYVYVCVLCASI